MRIICPTCASHYEVDPAKIGAAGQLVRCAACRDVWLVRPSDDVPRPQEQPATPRPSRPERDPNAFAVAAAAGAASRASSEAERSGRDGSGDRPIDFAAARSRLRHPDTDGALSRVREGSAGTLLSIAAACAAMVGVVVGFRSAIVGQLPQAAPAFAAVGLPVLPYGLALQDVRSVVSAEGGKTVLDLEGRIANLHEGPLTVPNLTVVVRDDRATPLYTWTTAAPKASLAGGETVAFRTRLSTPPTGGKDVRVSFADTLAVAR